MWEEGVKWLPNIQLIMTYHEDVADLCIHGNPASLRGNTEHAQWEGGLTAFPLTAAVAMATNTVPMHATTQLTTKCITMVTTVVDTWARGYVQYLWLEVYFDLCSWVGVLKHYRKQ